VDPLRWVQALERPLKTACSVPDDLASVTAVGEETPAAAVGIDPVALERIRGALDALFRTALYPAVQLCVRHRGEVVVHRALGWARGGCPDAAPDGPRVPVSVDTPFLLYSASKAVTAMLVHKLDEQHRVHLDDRVCDYIPEFGRHRKHWITLRHLLSHSAGIPNLPRRALDLDLLGDPEALCALLCELEPVHGAGRRLAYHAISGGFVLGEIVRRVTGQDLRAYARKELCEPLGWRWMSYGVAPEDIPHVAEDAATGLPVPPPFSWLVRRALGISLSEAVALAADPRFLTAVVPSANVVSTAAELCEFFECLRRGGELRGVRVFDPRTVRHATSEQTYLEVDLTLGLPLRYGLGFMLGGRHLGLFGWRTPRAFGHLGFTNIFGWADPERQLSVALLTSGKPFVGLDSLRLLELLWSLGQAFPRQPSRST